jgi:serine/threonine protein kinase/predicted ATPase
MTPERWQEVKRLYNAAQSLPPQERAAWILQNTPDDLDLRHEVEALIESHDQAQGFMDTSASSSADIVRSLDLTGRRVGPYELVEFIGAGGMGEVYKARDVRLDRTVAIKVLPTHVARNPQARERFEREARAVAALNHPHICTLYDVGEEPSPEPSTLGTEPVRFLVMEYVDGTTIDFAEDLPLAPDRVTQIAIQVCSALEAAHEKGIVHRDIKPLNIMLTHRGQVKVLDFGVAKLDETAPQPDTTPTLQTNTGMVVGTLLYMSPEQACGERVNSASDVFSLGVILYRLLTGKHPFSPDESHMPMQSLVRALLSQHPVPPRSLNSNVPPLLEEIVLHMLEKDPGRRPGAAEIRRRLEGPSDTSPRVPRQVRPSSRRRMVGRQQESALLEEAFENAASGSPILMTVVGEPGIGKTTIVEEFLKHLRDADLAYVARGRCSERLAGNEAYLPVLETLESLLAGDDRYSGAQQLLAHLAPTWYEQVSSAGRSSAAEAQPEQKPASQERLKREFRAFLEGVSRVKPLVLLFDDVHWSDVSTVDLLGYLCTRFGSMRLLLIATYRPTDLLLAKHPFAALKLDLSARGLCREVILGFLTRQEAATYLDLEFPNHQFPAALAAVIHEKTEGSPLFMVDLVRDLAGRGVIVRSDAGWTLVQSIPMLERDLPASVRSMIDRKIAQIADDDRQLLIGASVQGHAFDSAVVSKALGKDPAEVEERLEVLDRIHGFVIVLGEDVLPGGTPTVRCRFVHVLYQNALYASLRTTRRAALSAAVANALIELHGEHTAAIASELAFLFEAARDAARAAGYFLLAAQQALRVFAFVEAANLAGHGLRLLSSQPETPERNAIELKLQIAIGTAWATTKGYAAPDVGRAYGRARELCGQLGDPAELASVLFGLFVYYVVVPSHKVSIELGDEMLAIAEREKNASFRIQGLLMHGMSKFWKADLIDAAAELEQGIELNTARLDIDRARSAPAAGSTLFDHGIWCRRYHAVVGWLLGYPDKAAKDAAIALADTRALKQPFTMGSTLGFVSLLHHFSRDVRKTAEISAEGVACTREYELRYWLGFSRALHGWAIAQLNNAQWEEGIVEIQESLESHRSSGARTFGSVGAALLAETYMLGSRFEEAEKALDGGLALAEAADERFWEAELHRLRGALFLAQDRPEAAEQQFRQAVAVAQRYRQKPLELRALTNFYRLVRRQPDSGRIEQVRSELVRSLEWFTEGFETYDLLEAKHLLEERL